jgi:adenosylcobinamide kinase/adenosylcobinamide-phosphate guanylyltransferase
MSVTLVTGGARSGKSRYAEELCKGLGEKVCYIATAKAIDADMKSRIEKHKVSRPQEWKTLEKYDRFDTLVKNEIFLSYDTFLLDCITIMITNIMFDQNVDYDTCSIDILEDVEEKVLEEIKELIRVMKSYNKNLILVSNEVGMGLVPPYRLGSVFRDIAGRMNQYIAKEADHVYLTVCGLAQKLK